MIASQRTMCASAAGALDKVGRHILDITWVLIRKGILLGVLAIALPIGLGAASTGLGTECFSPCSILESGVVVETVGPDSSLAKAGLLPGDWIRAWNSTSLSSSSALETYLDWMWLLLEQVPRGSVELTVVRGSDEILVRVEEGWWEARVRPKFSEDFENQSIQGGLSLLDAAQASIPGLWHCRNSKKSRGALAMWVAKELRKRNKLDEALPLVQEVLGFIRFNEPLGLLAQLERSELLEQRGDLDNGKTILLELLDSSNRIDDKSRLLVLHLKNTLARIYWRLGFLAEASSLYDEILDTVAAEAPNSILEAQLWSNHGVILRQSNSNKSRELQEIACKTLAKLAPSSDHLAHCLSSLSILYFRRGKLERSGELLEEASEIFSEKYPEDEALDSVLFNLAALRFSTGDVQESLRLMTSVLKTREQRSAQSIMVANTLLNLGLFQRQLGYLQEARVSYQRAIQILTERAPVSGPMVTALGHLAAFNSLAGDYDTASFLHEEAIEILEELDPQGSQGAVALNNLALSLANNGNNKEQLDLLYRVLKIRSQFGPQGLALGQVHQNIGAFLCEDGRLDECSYHLNQADGIFREVAPCGIDESRNIRNLAGLEMRRGHTQVALDYLWQSIEIQEHIRGSHLHRAQALGQIGKIHLLLGDQESLTLAETQLSRAISLLEQQLGRFGGSYGSRTKLRSSFADIYRNFQSVQVMLGRPEDSFHTLERMRSRSFLERLAERELTFSLDIPDDLERRKRLLTNLIDRTFSELSLGAQGVEAKEKERQLQDLRMEAASIEAQIREVSPRLAGLQYPEPLNVAEIRDFLAEGTLLISLSVSEGSTLVYSLTTSGPLRVDTLNLTKDELSRRVKTLRVAIDRARSSDSDWLSAFEVESANLFEDVLAGVIARIDSAERILIIPDGPLHFLPWGALVRRSADGAGYSYLIESKPLHIEMSATVYGETIKNRVQRGGRVPTLDYVAFADPRFDGDSSKVINEAHEIGPRNKLLLSRDFKLARLPATLGEVTTISQLFPQDRVRVFLGEAALETTATAVTGHIGSLHFATHGILDERFPLYSFLALSTPQLGKTGDANGFLQVWEIFERMRFDADLVVLSACDSGLGQLQEGEGLIGLTQAFHYAGARSVVASLWSVSDRSTAELMIRFYKHLTSGLTKDEALRAAQMEFIQGPVEVEDENGEMVEVDYSSPYHRAAFQVYGDWQ